MGQQITITQKVKTALRIKSNDFNDEINDIISAALFDLSLSGISKDMLLTPMDYPLILRAVITYCRYHFGEPSDAERLKQSYDEQKAQLMISADYTEY